MSSSRRAPPAAANSKPSALAIASSAPSSSSSSTPSRSSRSSIAKNGIDTTVGNRTRASVTPPPQRPRSPSLSPLSASPQDSPPFLAQLPTSPVASNAFSPSPTHSAFASSSSSSSSLFSSSSSFSTLPSNQHILSFIDSIDAETERQERSLRSLQSSMHAIQRSAQEAEQQPRREIDANDALLSPKRMHDAQPSPDSSSSSSYTASTPSSSAASARTPTSSSSSSSLRPQPQTPNSLSHDLHALTNSNAADATFAKVRDKMVSLTESVQQYQRQIAVLNGQIEKMQASLDKERATHAASLEEIKKRFHAQLDQQLGFIDDLVKSKAALSEKIESMQHEAASVEQAHERRIESLAATHRMAIAAHERALEGRIAERQASWSKAESKRIKELTIKGMEKEMTRVIDAFRKKEEETRALHDQALLSAQTLHAEAQDALRRELSLRHTIEIEDRQARLDAALARQTELHSASIAQAVEQAEERARVSASKAQRNADGLFASYKAHMTRQIDEMKASHADALETAKAQLREACAHEKSRALEDALREHQAQLQEASKASEQREQQAVNAQLAHVVERLHEEHDAALRDLSKQHQREIATLKEQLLHLKDDWRREQTQQAKADGQLRDELAMAQRDVSESSFKLKDRERLLKEKMHELEQAHSALDDTKARLSQRERDLRAESELEQAASASRLEAEKQAQKLVIEALHQEQSQSMSAWRERVANTVAKKDSIIVELETRLKAAEQTIATQKRALSDLSVLSG